LVTGGAGGLGAATVRRLVEIGVNVAIFDRDSARAASLAAEIGKIVKEPAVRDKLLKAGVDPLGLSTPEFVKFLADDEGLKASHALMEKWLDSGGGYRASNSHLLIGPLKASAWAWAKTVTFLVNPDQLSALAIGAQYRSAPDDPPPVVAPFGSGCSQLVPFRDMCLPQASIGSTDIAMRQHLPPEILIFTVTRTMFEQLCDLGERSFLYKPFLERLKKARGGRL